jgi:hypothetical protein
LRVFEGTWRISLLIKVVEWDFVSCCVDGRQLIYNSLGPAGPKGEFTWLGINLLPFCFEIPLVSEKVCQGASFNLRCAREL